MRKNCTEEITYEDLMKAIQSEDFASILNEKQTAGVEYAVKLTKDHTSINKEYIQSLRDRTLDDGEILEINQVVSYFNYVNRMVVGLGVDTDGDIIGLSPNNNDESDNWSHS